MMTSDETTPLRPNKTPAAAQHPDEDEPTSSSSSSLPLTPSSSPSSCSNFYQANSFLILVVAAIGLARLYPPLGAKYLRPEITATWIAVMFVFFMAGLSIKTDQLSKAFGRFGFNAFVQIYNFVGVSLIVFGFTRAVMAWHGRLLPEVANAMMICACMPCTVRDLETSCLV